MPAVRRVAYGAVMFAVGPLGNWIAAEAKIRTPWIAVRPAAGSWGERVDLFSGGQVWIGEGGGLGMHQDGLRRRLLEGSGRFRFGAAVCWGGDREGDLLDLVDRIRETALIGALAGALDKRYPELFARGLVRHAGGVKEAWFARTEEPFQQIYSRRWCCGDPKDPAAITHHVECFGSHGTRQFGIDGPHTREHGVVIHTYSFAGGASPANTPRGSLPVLPKAAYAAACDLFDEIAAVAGLTAIKAEKTQGNGATRVVYDLTDDMAFESDYDTYRGLEELAEACVVAEHEGHKLRVTSSFLGHGTNATKCIVGYSKGGRYVFIHDFETELTHKPANRAAPRVFQFLEQMRKGAGR